MGFLLRHLRKITDAPYNTTGGAVQKWIYATPDAAAIVLAAGYFNDARPRLKVNDIIEIMSAADATGDKVEVRVTAVPTDTSNITVTSNDPGQPGNRAATATADGLTTGLLTASDKRVDVTAANATDIVTLPDIATVALNETLRLSVGANGHKLRTPATSNTKVNNVDCDGSQTMTVPANSITLITKQAADNWIAECFVAAGTRTIPTPA